MPIFTQLIIIFWLVFVVCWAVSAIGVKKNVRGGVWARGAGIRVLIVIVVILLFQVIPGRVYGEYFGYHLGYDAELVGTILCAAGIAFAIWARWHLGTNWSGTPSIKEGHELITSGPYRLVRHPIYTGILVALVGSSLVSGVDLIILIIFCAMFIFRIPVEERYMTELFSDQYRDYKKRTKTLIPFVW